MSFEQKTWTDRIAEYITRRTLTKTDGTTEVVTVERNEGEVSQEGDAFSASNMNDLEERIASEFTSVNNNLLEKLPRPDYSNIITSISSYSGLNYTATEDCYVMGYFGTTTAYCGAWLQINNVYVAGGQGNNGGIYVEVNFFMNKGDVLSTNTTSEYFGQIVLNVIGVK